MCLLSYTVHESNFFTQNEAKALTYHNTHPLRKSKMMWNRTLDNWHGQKLESIELKPWTQVSIQDFDEDTCRLVLWCYVIYVRGHLVMAVARILRRSANMLPSDQRTAGETSLDQKIADLQLEVQQRVERLGAREQSLDQAEYFHTALGF